jgi:hypothetical protein
MDVRPVAIMAYFDQGCPEMKRHSAQVNEIFNFIFTLIGEILGFVIPMIGKVEGLLCQKFI